MLLWLAACSPPDLLRTEVTLADENCVHGGIAVHAGGDRDRDGTLDDDEIETTKYACAGESAAQSDGAWLGSTTIRTLEDAEAMAGLHTITGNLVIEGPFEALSLPDLKVVGGTLRVGGTLGNALLRDLDLPALSWVGGGLWLENNLQLEHLEAFAGLLDPGPEFALTLADNRSLADASALGSFDVLGDVRISGDHQALDLGGLPLEDVNDLTLSGTVGQLDLPSLREVRGTLLTDGLLVPDLELPALEVVGELAVGATLQRLSAPALREVRGTASLVGATALREAELPALASCGLHLDVTNAPALQTLELDALEAIGGRVQLIWTGLAAFEAPALRTVPRNMMIKQNKKLARLHLPSLGDVATDPNFAIDLTGNTALTEITPLPPQAIEGSLFLHGAALEDLSAFYAITAVTGTLEVTGNPSIDCAEALALVDAIGRENIGGDVNLDPGCSD